MSFRGGIVVIEPGAGGALIFINVVLVVAMCLCSGYLGLMILLGIAIAFFDIAALILLLVFYWQRKYKKVWEELF